MTKATTKSHMARIDNLETETSDLRANIREINDLFQGLDEAMLSIAEDQQEQIDDLKERLDRLTDHVNRETARKAINTPVLEKPVICTCSCCEILAHTV